MNIEFYQEAAEIISVCGSLAEYVGYAAEEKDYWRVYHVAMPWRERVLYKWLPQAKEQVDCELRWRTGADGEPATIMEEGLYWISSFLGREGWEAAESVWVHHEYPQTEADRQTLMWAQDRAYIESEGERRDALRGRCRNLVDRFNAVLAALRGVGVSIGNIRAPDARKVVTAIRRATGTPIRKTTSKKSAVRSRGRSYPADVKKAVLGFIDAEFGGDVRGEGGWQAAYDSLTMAKNYTPRIQQHIGSAAALKRVVEAARKDAKRTKRKTRGQKK